MHSVMWLTIPCRDLKLELDYGHYVHDFEYEQISVEMKDFIISQRENPFRRESVVG